MSCLYIQLHLDCIESLTVLLLTLMMLDIFIVVNSFLSKCSPGDLLYSSSIPVYFLPSVWCSSHWGHWVAGLLSSKVVVTGAWLESAVDHPVPNNAQVYRFLSLWDQPSQLQPETTGYKHTDGISLVNSAGPC